MPMQGDPRVMKRLEKSIQWNRTLLDEWIREALAIAESRGRGGRCYPDKATPNGVTYLSVKLSPTAMRDAMTQIEVEMRERLSDAIHAGKSFKYSPKEYKAEVLALVTNPDWWRDE